MGRSVRPQLPTCIRRRRRPCGPCPCGAAPWGCPQRGSPWSQSPQTRWPPSREGSLGQVGEPVAWSGSLRVGGKTCRTVQWDACGLQRSANAEASKPCCSPVTHGIDNHSVHGQSQCTGPLLHLVRTRGPPARTCVGVTVPRALAQRDAAAAAGFLPRHQRLVVLRLGHGALCWEDLGCGGSLQPGGGRGCGVGGQRGCSTRVLNAG